MASLATEMPAEVLVGVTTPGTVQTSNPVVTNSNTHSAGIGSSQTSETDNINLNNTAANTANNNNTISAAADSSDNQPSTPQPHLTNSNESTQHSAVNQHPYANHNIYGNNSQQSAATSNSNPLLNQMYSQHIYSQTNLDLQQQSQHQHNLAATQNATYPSFLNSYENFYQRKQQNPIEAASQSQNSQQLDYINSGTLIHLRYHPYLNNPTSGIPAINSQNSNPNNGMDANSQVAPVVSAASSSVMSPRVVSSTSPSSSNQMQISGSASSIGSMSVGNPSSPTSAGSLQCKKCGVMYPNDSELQEHITNVHGASPYGSSGYASSPYIKEEMQQQTPPSQNQQQQPAGAQQTAAQGVNPGEILDLDSHKMLYPPAAEAMPAMMPANVGNTTDPLHGMHNMQQRAGIGTWDPQSQEAQSTYMQQQLANSDTKNISDHSSFYQSPKQSPYHITNSSNIVKTEYQPLIKCEYAGDTQQYMDDKSFDPTAPNQQQQMMPPAVSSSPAEFPTTTTGGPQDNQQQNVGSNPQFRGGSFEPPSSSSTNISTGPIGTKAANWKSNEARRPKTYNCTACNKWFTSSGHLKRHYNTTLHKNAVKSSGQPDPATLPISAHHHPARDPNGKTGRGRGTNVAGNAANNNAQQQQQPPNPVQPPEPPNSPQGYGGSQVAAAGLTPLSHYSATSPPNSMFEHQYPQHQYVAQVQSTTNTSPLHATSMSNQHLLQNQQQQTVLNGHPNALAGLSVPTTMYQHQTPMPSSQMRGLLNSPMLFSTATNMLHIARIEHLEAETTQDQHQAHEKEAEDFDYLSKVEVKQEYLEEMEGNEQYKGENIMYCPKDEKDILIYQLESAQVPREVDHNVEHHHNTSPQQIQHYQLDPAQQEDMEHFCPNTTHSNTLSNNTQVRLPPITSHQLYQAQQQQHQTVDQVTYTPMQTPPQQYNTTAQHYINMHLVTNMPLSNMPQLQPQLTTMGQQQLPPATTIPTTNTVSIQPVSHHHTQPPPLQHMELQPQANMSLQLGTINTNTPSHTTTTNNIPSFHQPQHQDSVQPHLGHTLTCPPTITGNAEIMSVVSNSNLIAALNQQAIQASDGQLPAHGAAAAKTGPNQNCREKMAAAQKSPNAGDLPPITLYYQQDPNITYIPLSTTPNSISCSPNQYLTDSSEIEYKPSLTEGFIKKHFGLQAASDPPTPVAHPPQAELPNKRSRNPSSSSSVGANSTVLPSGRLKCLPCDKEFTKTCYLTQHNNSFHSGEYPYRCQKCGKRYQTEEAFVAHFDKHKTTDKAHKCELCPKQFHHKTDLRRHIEAIHTGNKQHSCDICEKSFCRKDHLRKHLETHNRTRVVAKKKPARDNVAAAPKTKTPKDSPNPTVEIVPNGSATNPNDLNKNNITASHLRRYCSKLKMWQPKRLKY